MKAQDFIVKNTYSLSGRTVAITGATGSIGCELCEILAMLDARIVMLDRNIEKSNALKEKLKSKYKNLAITNMQLDLEDIDSVKNIVPVLLNMDIDILMLNAGAYHVPLHQSSTGFNNIFQINFASPYYIAEKMYPSLLNKNGKIIITGSLSYLFARFDKNDIDYSLHKGKLFADERIYGNAKRMLMFSLMKLCESTDVLSICHPGISFTNLMTGYKKPFLFFVEPIMKLIFMHPKKACLSMIYGIFNTSEKGLWIGPKYFGIWGFPKKMKLHTYNDAEASEMINCIYFP